MPDTTRNELARLRASHEAMAAELIELRHLLARPRKRRALLPALFLALLVALVPLSLLAANPFTDLTGGVHDPNIDAIYEAGVTTGCAPHQEYCPTDNVTREEMASFLARLGGLGANPPVADAKTLQGFAPGSLARVARASGFTDDTTVNLSDVAGQYAVVATVALEVPGPGFVLVTGTVTTVGPVTAPGIAYTQTRLRDTSPGGATSPVVRTAAGVGPGAADNIPATATWVFTVPAGGERAYAIETARLAGESGRAINGLITALYVPFGPTGGTTLDVP